MHVIGSRIKFARLQKNSPLKRVEAKLFVFRDEVIIAKPERIYWREIKPVIVVYKNFSYRIRSPGFRGCFWFYRYFCMDLMIAGHTISLHFNKFRIKVDVAIFIQV